jgi:hypothetical protein
MAVDEEPNDGIVHLDGFGEGAGVSMQSFTGRILLANYI